MDNNITKDMIAPCGMNCALCAAVLDKRSRAACEGCKKDGVSKREGCKRCVIKNCGFLKETARAFVTSANNSPVSECALLTPVMKKITA